MAASHSTFYVHSRRELPRSAAFFPEAGKILALVLLYEIHDISRFPSVQGFASYCRLVKSKKESAGKVYGTSGNKIGKRI